MTIEYKLLEEEINDLRRSAMKGDPSGFITLLPAVKVRAKRLGVEIPGFDGIVKTGYANCAKNKVNDAYEFINQGNYRIARVALRLAERWACEGDSLEALDEVENAVNKLGELEQGK